MERVVIVGGGISGLALAFELVERGHGFEVTVLEGREHVGGNVWTERVNGYSCEVGANGFLDNKAGTLRLSQRLNLLPIRSNDAARKRCIFTGGRMRMIPESPVAFFLSNFISLPGRARMVSDLLVPRKELDDESLESFAVRRVGREFFDKLIDPMASGIYAGDPSRMSVRSCFAKVYELERNHGGLIRGFMALARERGKSGEKVEAGPGGVLHSYELGMGSLVDALRERLGERVLTGKRVEGIEKIPRGYGVHCADGSIYESNAVVVTAPAFAAAMLLAGLDVAVSRVLSQIPYPPVSVIALGFRRETIKRDLDLFGFLVSGKERRKVLGCLFDSSIFPNRAPEGRVLLRCIVGGARSPELALLDDEPLLNMVRAELADMAGVNADPEFVWIHRHDKAIPQYEVGHFAKLDALDEGLARHPGLFLGGSALRGVAVNDCIANASVLADRILSEPLP